MKKKHHNKRKQIVSQKTNTPSRIVFTLPVLKILKDSLATFEILLLANKNKTIPHLEFAHLTFDELKIKLTAMLEWEEWEEEKSFDYNEIWILYTSLVMYVAELQISNTKNTAKLPLCLKLCNQFNALVEAHQ